MSEGKGLGLIAQVPQWVFAIAALLIAALMAISFFTGRQFSISPPNIGFIPPSSENSEKCNSWTTDTARLPSDIETWKTRTERSLNISKPKRGQVYATISTARDSANRTDIHFWWCGDGGGPEWQISETNQYNWTSALKTVSGSTPVGFFEGPQGGWSLWYLTPR